MLLAALTSQDARIRGFAATALCASGLDAETVAKALRPGLADPDAMVRASAVRAVGTVDPDIVDPMITDISPVVRRSVMTTIAEAGDPERLHKALDGALLAQATDTIATAANRFC